MFVRRAVAAVFAGAATLASAARNITVYNNDTSVAYTGFSWTPYTNCGGTRYTYSKGQFFTFNFVGTGVYVVGTQSLEGGVINISLDGEQSSFDRYALPPYRCGVQWFGRSGLPNQSHTLTVTLVANSPQNSTTNGFIEWQWLLYTQPDANDLASTSIGGGSITSPYPSPTPTPQPTPEPKNSGSSGAAIGGGVAGGLAALIAGAVAIWWFCFRRKSTKSEYGKTDLGGGGDPFPTSTPYNPGPMMNQASNLPGATAWTPDPYAQQSLSPGATPYGQPAAQPYVGQPGAQPYGGQPAHPGFNSQPSYASSTTPLSPGSVAGPAASVLSGAALMGAAAGAGATSGYGGQQQYSSAGSQYGGNPANASYNVSNSDPYQPSNQPTNPFSVSNPDPYPAVLNPASNGYNPSSVGPGSTGSGGGGVAAAGPKPMHETDVDRIAARVASMIGQQNPGYPGPGPMMMGHGQVHPGPDFDAPPPMYNEKQ